MRKTFIEATPLHLPGKCGRTQSLPLMRKTFIEASLMPWGIRMRVWSLFRLCGRLSLRLVVLFNVTNLQDTSLPLMRKTFIEACKDLSLFTGHPSLFRLCGRLSLRPGLGCAPLVHRHVSLPLMRKTFIEATATPLACRPQQTVSSAYAEDFH